MEKNNKLLGASIITAIAASLCCITPVLALVAGTSGFAAAFSWIAPIRPYLIALTLLVLAIAWYLKLRPKTTKELECDCPEDRPKFLNSKKFLFLITLLTGLLLAFPYYSRVFYPTSNLKKVFVAQSKVWETLYKIEGMTCEGCEAHVESEVNKLEGIIFVKADYKKGNVQVIYDTAKVDPEAIKEAILRTGYKIIR